ncbi:MAG TPA: GNAT family N-acetyltransferase [Dyadobacter sp.]|jgi:PhnO protein|nr:GNAT family N-acetyltransferase [Dyadobacter sp.]
MQNHLVIRYAMEADMDVIYDMICELENQQLDKVAFSRVYLKNIQNPDIDYFLAILDDKSVGMVSCHVQGLLHHAALVAEIQEMFVYADYRSQGIGELLMTRVVQYAIQKGAIQMEVTSRATREAAHRFYERESFLKSHVKLVRYLDKM